MDNLSLQKEERQRAVGHLGSSLWSRRFSTQEVKKTDLHTDFQQTKHWKNKTELHILGRNAPRHLLQWLCIVRVGALSILPGWGTLWKDAGGLIGWSEACLKRLLTPPSAYLKFGVEDYGVEAVSFFLMVLGPAKRSQKGVTLWSNPMIWRKLGAGGALNCKTTISVLKMKKRKERKRKWGMGAWSGWVGGRMDGQIALRTFNNKMNEWMKIKLVNCVSGGIMGPKKDQGWEREAASEM